MALFAVPGWSVPDALATDNPSGGKKRKRGAGQTEEKVTTAEINFEKLMQRLESGTDNPSPHPKKQKGNQKSKPAASDNRAKDTTPRAKAAERGAEPGKKNKRAERREKKKKWSSSAAPNHEIEVERDAGEEQAGSPPKRKGAKFETETKRPKLPVGPKMNSEEKAGAGVGLTAMQAGMKHSLDGARFRWINELLYKSDSSHAHEMMRENRSVFEEYHTGFRHQVRAWPTNPVEHYVEQIAKYPARTVVADLGCGDAALACALVPKGMTVLSYDLVSDGAYITEADICAHIPLPGSEGTDEGEPTAGVGHVVDISVCALSLMGTNWPHCVREAWRILKEDGELKIAEVASRFTDIDAFVKLVCSFGFRLESKDARNTHFTLFEFKKIVRKPKSDKEWIQLMSHASILKPCEYKRR